MTAPGAHRPQQMHLAAHLPGAGGTDGFAAFRRLAGTAERGLFDFLLLDEDPRLHEHRGRSGDSAAGDPDAVVRPEPVTVLSALAAVTERIGLAAGLGTTCRQPYTLARRVASLDHLSGGRAAWNAVASGEGGGRPDRAGARARTAEFAATARELWDSWTPEGVPRPFAHHGRHFSLSGTFDVPRSPQGRPVVIRAGDSEEDREFAACAADVILTRHGTREAGRAFRADAGRRLSAYGRLPGDLKVMRGVTPVLGDTDAEARERAAGLRRPPVPPPAAVLAGTPAAVAARLEEWVTAGAADGFVLVPHPDAGGLGEFVDRVVPLLQERGAFRTEYTGATLREHLGLPLPVWKS
ncbi:LLM class flavin-dependent oxidoreductase [Streptomyces sp. URMC 124]|uniref:LLM class flavin-dependent oxidoreductase n=1 Tax=Streptomyces sp. URMC 124 TaxID=3423405 RepID=UPI003F1AE0AC